MHYRSFPETDDLSEEECMKLWQIRQVRRPQLFVKKLNSWSADYKEKIDMALETIWPTKGDVFDSTKLKNFVKKRVNPKGGYIGHTDFLGEKILESLEKIGYEFPEKEEEEQINNCVNELVKKLAIDANNKLMIEENLRNCWDLIIERNFKLGEQLFLNHDK